MANEDQSAAKGVFIHLDSAQRRELERIAKEDDRTFRAIVRIAVHEFLDRRRKVRLRKAAS